MRSSIAAVIDLGLERSDCSRLITASSCITCNPFGILCTVLPFQKCIIPTVCIPFCDMVFIMGVFKSNMIV